MDGSLSEAMEASAGALPALTAQLQLLSRHAGLALAIFVGILFLLVVLSELYANQEEALAIERGAGLGGSGLAGDGKQHPAMLGVGTASEAANGPMRVAGREADETHARQPGS